MDTNNVSCTILGQKYRANDYSDAAAYAGHSYGTYYNYALKFTIPEFSGVPEGITFALAMSDGQSDTDKTTATVRYALCCSDANFSKYETSAEVTSSEDPYQMANGVVTFTGLSSVTAVKTLTIPVSALTPGATCYLILWGCNDLNPNVSYLTVEKTDGHSVSLAYNSGLIQLVIDGQAVSCAVDVFVNGAWAENLMPEVFADGAFVVCS